MMTASEMGKKGGKRSAESRFKGKSKKEISKIMSEVRQRKHPKLQVFHEAFMESLTKNQKEQF